MLFRSEGEALLQRRSGDVNNPRILTAFNEKTSHWLAFFMFTFFTDRDGKFQLSALAESGFDPLARTVRFMLTEEAHHMFVGETGVARVIQRTCDVMREHGLAHADAEAIRRHGVIDFDTLQRFVNFHYSVTLDLFGGEISSNAGSMYSNGLKGRYEEARVDDDHGLSSAEYGVPQVDGGRVATTPVPALTALNARLRDDYTSEIAAALARWNRIPEKAGLERRLVLPHVGFHRKIGVFAGHHISPDGRVLTADAWANDSSNWLPRDADHQYVSSLMGRVVEPGQFAGWIAPPARGINNQPIDFQYVRFD